jgi:hypothetical protein
MNFITNKNFTIVAGDLTKKFQKDLRNNINECQSVIHKDDKWKDINLKPSPPMIRGLIKIHKKNFHIRPTVNWTNAPAYTLDEQLSKKLSVYIPLPYTFNVKNTVHVMNELCEIPFEKNVKLVSFSITNVYFNTHTKI